MFELSERAKMGLYIMVHLATHQESQHSIEAMAHNFDVNANHLAKVAQRLRRAGWIGGSRGARGGYRLLVDPKKISMAAIVTLLDGTPRRSQKTRCAAVFAISEIVSEVGQQALYTLDSVMVSTLVREAKRWSG